MADQDLVTIKGLVDSDFDNPLRKFDGIFAGYETSPAQGYAGTRVDLKFKDLDNIVAVSPFNFPTTVINLGLSNKNKSRWGYFANSLKILISADEDIKDQADKTFTMVYCDGQDGRPAPKLIWSKDADPAEYPDKMVPTVVWIVVAINGQGVQAAGTSKPKSAAEWAEENLIGKTRAEFNKWAFADLIIRKDVPFQRSITDKSFITALIAMKRAVEDANGVFQKV